MSLAQRHLCPPSRHCDSRPCTGRQSRRFLETGSLIPPPAVLRLFPPYPLKTAQREGPAGPLLWKLPSGLELRPLPPRSDAPASAKRSGERGKRSGNPLISTPKFVPTPTICGGGLFQESGTAHLAETERIHRTDSLHSRICAKRHLPNLRPSGFSLDRERPVSLFKKKRNGGFIPRRTAEPCIPRPAPVARFPRFHRLHVLKTER